MLCNLLDKHESLKTTERYLRSLGITVKTLNYINTNYSSTKSIVLPSFLSGISSVLFKTSDITGQRSAYETSTGPLALRTKDEGTRAKNGHFLASSIVEKTSNRLQIKTASAVIGNRSLCPHKVDGFLWNVTAFTAKQ